MKKFIALAAALVSFGAFAHNHMEDRHMVTVSGWEDMNSVTSRSLDLNYNNGSGTVTKNIALNYAYAFTGTWQLGASLKKYEKTTDGDVTAAGNDTMTYGLRVIYNFAGQLADTNYLSLNYDMLTAEDSKGNNDGYKVNTLALEFGHRFSLGQLWSMDFNWSPSVSLGAATTDPDSGKESTTTVAQLNVLKMDILF